MPANSETPQEFGIRDLYQHPVQTSPAIFIDETRLKPGTWAEGRSLMWGMGLTLGGYCNYQVEGRQTIIQPGDFAICKPRFNLKWEVPVDTGPRSLSPGARTRKGQDWHTIYTIFEPRAHWFPWLGYEELMPGLILLPLKNDELRAQIQRDLRSACRTYLTAGPQRDDWVLLKLEEVLLRLFMHRQEENSSVDPRVQTAVEFIRQHYARPLSLREISQAAHLSVSQLSLLFSNQIGVAPIQYLESVRLTRALEMLRFSSDSIAQIAAATGFLDPEYFSRRVRLHLGESPREFRKRTRVLE